MRAYVTIMAMETIGLPAFAQESALADQEAKASFMGSGASKSERPTWCRPQAVF